MRALTLAAALVPMMLIAGLASADSLPLADFDGAAPDITVAQGLEGSVSFSLDGDPRGGKCLAVEFTRLGESTTAYVKLPIAAAIAESGSKFDGLTMKVRGDGSATYGLIEIVNDAHNGRYQAVFPLTSKDWTTVAIRWSDFFANGDKAKAFLDPSTVMSFAFGSRERWASARYAVDDIALAAIPAPAPVVARPGTDRLAHFGGKARQGRARHHRRLRRLHHRRLQGRHRQP